jgi:hypothetical protein
VIQSARAARAVFQIAAETRLLRDALAPHTTFAADVAQCLAALYVASQGKVQLHEAVALIESTLARTRM